MFLILGKVKFFVKPKKRKTYGYFSAKINFLDQGIPSEMVLGNKEKFVIIGF